MGLPDPEAKGWQLESTDTVKWDQVYTYVI